MYSGVPHKGLDMLHGVYMVQLHVMSAPGLGVSDDTTWEPTNDYTQVETVQVILALHPLTGPWNVSTVTLP